MANRSIGKNRQKTVLVLLLAAVLLLTVAVSAGYAIGFGKQAMDTKTTKAENKTLTAQVAELTEKNNLLTEQNNSLSAQNEELSGQLAQTIANADAANVESMRQQIADLTKQNEEMSLQLMNTLGEDENEKVAAPTSVNSIVNTIVMYVVIVIVAAIIIGLVVHLIRTRGNRDYDYDYDEVDYEDGEEDEEETVGFRAQMEKKYGEGSYTKRVPVIKEADEDEFAEPDYDMPPTPMALDEDEEEDVTQNTVRQQPVTERQSAFKVDVPDSLDDLMEEEAKDGR